MCPTHHQASCVTLVLPVSQSLPCKTGIIILDCVPQLCSVFTSLSLTGPPEFPCSGQVCTPPPLVRTPPYLASSLSVGPAAPHLVLNLMGFTNLPSHKTIQRQSHPLQEPSITLSSCHYRACLPRPCLVHSTRDSHPMCPA